MYVGIGNEQCVVWQDQYVYGVKVVYVVIVFSDVVDYFEVVCVIVDCVVWYGVGVVVMNQYGVYQGWLVQYIVFGYFDIDVFFLYDFVVGLL